MSYLPLWLMGVLAVVTWIPEVRRWIRDRRPRVRGSVLLGHEGTPASFMVQVNGPSLCDYRDKYNVALVCGMTDPTVDRFNETRIAISDAFTITAAEFPIRVEFTEPFHRAIQAQLEAAQKKANEILAPGTPYATQLTASFWTEMLLLPHGTSTKDIHKLADVKKHGGKIISNIERAQAAAAKP